ncbi:MAG TPA: sigma-70 family RNA polymerase sigma factor [Planctomycetota bacterium]|nr:sigma-70 family RNA polymerase sigma factor [Planctomycetota bacterium]
MAEMPEPEALLEHRAFLRAIAKGLLRDDDAAEDVVQEALLAAMERPPEGPNLRGWLGAVARNLSRMARRGERRRRERELRAARPEAVGPADEALQLIEVQRRVVEAVRALDEPYRTAIVLHYFHDLSVRELAARLRVPQETARTRLKRGLAMLRARLDAQCGGNRSWLPLLALLAMDPRKVSVAGVALMSAKAKVAVAAVVCILLTLAAVKWGGSGGSGPPPRAETARAPAPREAEASLPPAPALPDPVDFNAVDRERDLHGIVVDRAGSPIAGAELRTVSYPYRRVAMYRPEADAGIDGPGTRSAEDGTFRIRLEPAQEVWLRASARGCATIEIPRLQAGGRVRVVLPRPGVLVVRVTDQSGSPVEAAEVDVKGTRDIEIERTAYSDAQGRATFDRFPEDTLVMVNAVHPDYGSGFWIETRAGAEVEYVLPAGRMRTGRVVDAATGRPIAAAQVGIGQRLSPDTRTDAHGTYRLNGWTGEDETIYAVADGYVMAWARLGAATEHDFSLQKGIDAYGRVLDADGRPVAGAALSALGDKRGSPAVPLSRAHATSGSDGTFRLTPLEAKTPHSLVVQARDHGLHVINFETANGTTQVGDIVLPRGLRIAGVAQDTAGSPVARAFVLLLADRAFFRGEGRFTDDLGRFQFPDVSPGTYRLSVSRGTDKRASQTVRVGDEDVLDVRFMFPVERTFVVWVTDDAEAPVTGAQICIDHAGGASFARSDAFGRAEAGVSGRIEKVHGPQASPYGHVSPITDLPEDATEARFVLPRWEEIRGMVTDADGTPISKAVVEGRREPGVSEFVTTDGHGRFRLVVPPGSVADIHVTARYKPSQAAGGTLVQRADIHGEVRDVLAGARDVVIRVEPRPYDRKITVRVLAPDGTPLEGASVGCSPSLPDGSVETGADGRVSIANAPDEEILVWCQVDSRALGFVGPKSQRVTANGQEIEMRCRTGIPLRGTVVGPDGKPVSGARVSAADESRLSYEAFSDAQGRFEILVPEDLESAALSARDRTGLYGSLTHRVAAGEATIAMKRPK